MKINRLPFNSTNKVLWGYYFLVFISATFPPHPLILNACIGITHLPIGTTWNLASGWTLRFFKASTTRALNLHSPRRQFIWRRKGSQQKDKRNGLVRRKITCFSRNYCSDIRAFQKITFARQSHCLSPSCLSFGNDLDVRRKSGSGKNCRTFRRNLLVCPTIPAHVFAYAMDAEEGNFLPRIPRCWNCTDWSPLFHYDQSLG